ncbi:MAG: hypothetical protein RLY71_859 [Pseudomonadota bacterium]|jgi:outer membrane protein OmpA-like peptidoglycan-associated protein
MRHLLQFTILPAALATSLLGSCGSPPKPPTVDESRKRPANTAAAVNLQRCESELHNTLIVANEVRREAAAASAVAARLVAQQALVARIASASAEPGATSAVAAASAPLASPSQAPPAAIAPAPRNIVYAIFFGYASTEVQLPEGVGERLIADARQAPLVILRGRTDGISESPGETRVARGRVSAVRAYLLQAGVDDWRIRSTWQPVGDFIADNASPEGRARNRRVEIEIYREAPQLLAMGITSVQGQQR